MENLGIYEKLSAIQQELKAPKGQYNSFGKYKYRSCEDILEAVKPLCAKAQTTLVLQDEIVEIGGRFYVRASASLCSAEGTVSTTAYAREPEKKTGMDESQITGTASSYARKYALNGLFCIDDTKDADTDAYKQQQSAGEAPSKKEMQEFNQNYKKQYESTCQDCGKPIIPMKCNGKIYKISEISAGAMKKYGVPLCWACMNKRNGETNESSST